MILVALKKLLSELFLSAQKLTRRWRLNSCCVFWSTRCHQDVIVKVASQMLRCINKKLIACSANIFYLCGPQPARSSTSQSCQQIFGSLRVMTLVIIATRKKFVQLQKFVSLAVKPGKTLTPSFRLLRVAKIPKNRDFWNPPFLNRSKTKTRKGVFLTFLAIFWLFDDFGGGGTPPTPPFKK